MIKWLWDCCGTRATPMDTTSLGEFKKSQLNLQKAQAEPLSPTPILDYLGKGSHPRDRLQTLQVTRSDANDLLERQKELLRQIDELKLKRTAIPAQGKTIGQKITDNKYAAEIKELNAQLEQLMKQRSAGSRHALSPRQMRGDRLN